MISDDHLIPSGIDFGRSTSAFQKWEAPTLIFMTQSQKTGAFLAIFVQFPPATAKTQPRMWHHSISASPSGGNAAICIPHLKPQELTTHLNCWENGDSILEIPNWKQKTRIDWVGFFSSFSRHLCLYEIQSTILCLKYSYFCMIMIPPFTLLRRIPVNKGNSGSVSEGGQSGRSNRCLRAGRTQVCKPWEHEESHQYKKVKQWPQLKLKSPPTPSHHLKKAFCKARSRGNHT